VVAALDVSSSALPETINSPNAGLAAAASDFSTAVKKLLEDPEALARRRTSSLEFARQTYDLKIFESRMLKLYEELEMSFRITSDGDLLLSQLTKYSKDYWRNRNRGPAPMALSAGTPVISSISLRETLKQGPVSLRAKTLILFLVRGLAFLRSNGLRSSISEFQNWRRGT
jgi:glycosyltransferase involved in cell wall biosynthesis